MNIRDEIRQVLDTSDLTDPREIAAKVAEQIPEYQLREVVTSLLPDVVRDIIRGQRNRAPGEGGHTSDEAQGSDASLSRPQTPGEGGHKAHDTQGRTALPSRPQTPGEGGHSSRDAQRTPAALPRSWKRDSIREAHLRDRYHVDGEWKMLRSMTAEDLEVAARERQQIAAKNAVLARRLGYWAGLVRRHGVPTFGALPLPVLQQELGV